MVELVKRLGANVQGDDGKIYGDTTKVKSENFLIVKRVFCSEEYLEIINDLTSYYPLKKI
jgi:hypothetical protein